MNRNDNAAGDDASTKSSRGGCGCLGAILGFAIVSGISHAVANRPGGPGSDGEGLVDFCNGIVFGALIGALLGAVLASSLYALLRPLCRKWPEFAVSCLIFVLGILLASCVESFGSHVILAVFPPPISRASGVGIPTSVLLAAPGVPAASPPMSSNPARRPNSRRIPPHTLNPALEPGDY